ncbi:hypothetical protein TYRP_009532 [Tyrophagus putrescentiae]|nr:hypothetical protein TYRP_009532 [Tyrophagus putrescentiae]
MPKRKANSSASSKHHHNHNHSHHQQNHNNNKKNTSTSSSSSSSSSSKTSKSSKKPAHINYASTDPKSLYPHPNRTINQLRFSLIVYQLILLNSRPKYYFKRYIIKIGLLGTMFSYLFISVLMAFLYYQEERYGISTTSVNGHPGLAHLDYYLHLYMFRIGPCTLVLMLWGLLWTIFTDRLECYLTGMITPEEFVRCIPGLLVASIFTFGLTSLLPLIGGLSIESIGRFVYYLLKIDDGGGGGGGKVSDSAW